MNCSSTTRMTAIGAIACALAISLASPALAQSTFDRQNFAATVDSLAIAYLADGPVAGVAIAVEKDGEIILAKGYGLAEIEHNVPVTVETVFRIGSISKQFGAVAILQLVERGAIRLDDPITKFIPDYPTQGREITVHHLLTHTSGIKSFTGMEGYRTKSRQDVTHEEMIEWFGPEPFDFAPGEQWRYNNSGYYLIGVIVERARQTLVASSAPLGGPKPGPKPGESAVGPRNANAMYGATSAWLPTRPTRVQVAPAMSLSDYLEENIFAPIGMTGSSYCDETAIVPHRAEGYERQGGKLVNDQAMSMTIPGVAGALCSTVLDLLRWQRALDNNTLISAESRAKMVTESTLTDGSGTRYGYGVFLGDFEGHRHVSHGGGINGFNTQHATYPDDDLIVTVFANTAGANPAQLEKQITRLALGLPLEVTLDLATDEIALSRYAGTYFFEEMEIRATVEIRDGRLWFVAPGLGEVRLKYQGGNAFELAPGQQVEFTPDADPAGAELRAGGTVLTGVKEGG